MDGHLRELLPSFLVTGAVLEEEGARSQMDSTTRRRMQIMQSRSGQRRPVRELHIEERKPPPHHHHQGALGGEKKRPRRWVGAFSGNFRPRKDLFVFRVSQDAPPQMTQRTSRCVCM
jgi:hypothetical protein